VFNSSRHGYPNSGATGGPPCSLQAGDYDCMPQGLPALLGMDDSPWPWQTGTELAAGFSVLSSWGRLGRAEKTERSGAPSSAAVPKTESAIRIEGEQLSRNSRGEPIRCGWKWKQNLLRIWWDQRSLCQRIE
jgi:hypothetical protein